MANVNNFDYLSEGPYELSNGQIEKPFISYIDSQLSELNGNSIRFAVPLVALAPGYGAFDFLGGLGGVPPLVSNISPAGGTGIQKETLLSFDVTVSASNFFREIIVIADFPNLRLKEIIHMDDAFGPQYSLNSSRVAITGGYRFSVMRNAGWPGSPTILVKAIDVQGAENV